MGLLLAAIIALPVITWANGPASETEADYIQFASSVVELYYRNKDAGENNDLSPFVSEEALKLMNAKCHLSQRKLDLLGLEHNDYQVRIQPIDTEDWYETDTEVYLRLAIVSQWFFIVTPPTSPPAAMRSSCSFPKTMTAAIPSKSVTTSTPM